jgi:hypothetical protein
VRFNLRVMMAGHLPPEDRTPAAHRSAAAPPGHFAKHLECAFSLNLFCLKNGPSAGTGL